MSKTQIIGLFFIIVGLTVVLTFTFQHFKQEEQRILEAADKNKMMEEQDKKEREAKELEEKRKKEEGQKQVDTLLEQLKNTKKLVLATYDETGKIISLATSRNFIEMKTITDENTLKEIQTYFASAIWQEGRNDNFLNSLWQFYDAEDKLILEYEGHAFINEESNVAIYFPEETLKKLNAYFNEG